jgi:hypothetical protein
MATPEAERLPAFLRLYGPGDKLAINHDDFRLEGQSPGISPRAFLFPRVFLLITH